MLSTNFIRDKIDKTHRNVFTVYNNSTWFQLWFLFCDKTIFGEAKDIILPVGSSLSLRKVKE